MTNLMPVHLSRPIYCSPFPTSDMSREIFLRRENRATRVYGYRSVDATKLSASRTVFYSLPPPSKHIPPSTHNDFPLSTAFCAIPDPILHAHSSNWFALFGPVLPHLLLAIMLLPRSHFFLPLGCACTYIFFPSLFISIFTFILVLFSLIPNAFILAMHTLAGAAGCTISRNEKRCGAGTNL